MECNQDLACYNAKTADLKKLDALEYNTQRKRELIKELHLKNVFADLFFGHSNLQAFPSKSNGLKVKVNKTTATETLKL